MGNSIRRVGRQRDSGSMSMSRTYLINAKKSQENIRYSNTKASHLI